MSRGSPSPKTHQTSHWIGAAACGLQYQHALVGPKITTKCTEIMKIHVSPRKEIKINIKK
jgi:hypothetical protein